MLDLDPYGGTDQLLMFPLFADVMAPRLSVVFCKLDRLGSFKPYWRQANVTPIPKGLPSSSVANCRPICVTLYCRRCLSAWCLFVLADLCNVMVFFQPPTLLKGLETCDALLVSHSLQSALERGQ